VSERQLDEQIGQAFAALTRPPRPQLTERIRDGLWSRPAARTPLALPPPLTVLVAALLVLAVVAALLEGPAAVRAASAVGRGVNGAVSRALTPPRTASTHATVAHQSPTAPATAVPTPAPTPAPTGTPIPVPTPTAPVATLPGFSCATQTGGGGQGTMSTARVGAQNGYDRFVIQFAGPVPQFEVALLGSPSFAPAGSPVTLPGEAGIQVTLHDASGAGAFSGPSDMKPGFSEIQEARLLSDSQGVVLWGVGLAHAACFHAWVLPGPSRLVIDVAR
jgi:hypothetical protein